MEEWRCEIVAASGRGDSWVGRPALPPGPGRCWRWLDGGLASLALLLFLADPLLSEKKEPGLRVL